MPRRNGAFTPGWTNAAGTAWPDSATWPTLFTEGCRKSAERPKNRASVTSYGAARRHAICGSGRTGGEGMKILIVEDDYTSRIVLHRLLLPFGETEIAVTGNQAVSAFSLALKGREPFDLVCLDIMLPGLDGQAVLKEIRTLESSGTREGRKPVKVVMTTALSDRTNVVEAIKHCDGYLVKPIDRKKLVQCLKDFGFEPAPTGAKERRGGDRTPVP